MFRRGLSGLLVCALLFATTLGLLHPVVHAPEAMNARLRLQAASDGTREQGGGWLVDLFAGHGDDRGCRVFDQQSHADALLFASPPALPVVFALFPKAIFDSAPCVRRALPFQARGPPAFF